MLQEKLNNDPLHPSAFIHWIQRGRFHGSDPRMSSGKKIEKEEKEEEERGK